MTLTFPRRLPIGAEYLRDEGVHFRVWSPSSKSVEVFLESAQDRRRVPLTSEGSGYWSEFISDAIAGDLYGFHLDNREQILPDPASRFQPEGPHGLSLIVDPLAYVWHDESWKGRLLEGSVLYELHIGTFTPEGTWKAAEEQLPELRELGVDVVEVMPVADFPGRFGWGYDGVNLFAPTRLYGKPDELRSFVDAAHRLELAVILDVVYNHVGPDGNYLESFSKDYFTDRYKNEWGGAINFDGSNSAPVREFFTANARYWVEEFHFDGLRLDATQQIFDSSHPHIIADIEHAVRSAARHRETIVVAESEIQQAALARPRSQGGYGLDGIWNDDFHHSAIVALTGKNEAYYSDYMGNSQELLSCAQWGFLYQGQRSQWQKQCRGSSALDLAPATKIIFLQNHDQVANSAAGRRVHDSTSAAAYRAMTALLLLMPGTPMLFQGQEFGSSSPFHYFADHHSELAALVHKGRKEFQSQFKSIAIGGGEQLIPVPHELETFETSKLVLDERNRHRHIYRLHQDLILLRKQEPFSAGMRRAEGAIISPSAFMLRYVGEGTEALMLFNFGSPVLMSPLPFPLLAPPLQQRWELVWSSDDPRYQGGGYAAVFLDENWYLPGNAAFVFLSKSNGEYEQSSPS